MKKILITSISILGLFAISCSRDLESANVGKVTNYPTIEVTGANPYFIPQGGLFTEPGVVAKEGSEVIPFTTKGSGDYRGASTIDTSKTDEYTVEYTATNKDGFKASGNRRVIVYKTGDLITSIEGVYTCTVSRNNVTPNANYQNIKYIHIWKNTDGTFGISDCFGGWYEYGRALGLDYITPSGTISGTISTNTFTFPGNPLTNSGFGGTANITEVTVDPSTKIIVLKCQWVTSTGTNFNFISTLKQVQL